MDSQRRGQKGCFRFWLTWHGYAVGSFLVLTLSCTQQTSYNVDKHDNGWVEVKEVCSYESENLVMSNCRAGFRISEIIFF